MSQVHKHPYGGFQLIGGGIVSDLLSGKGVDYYNGIVAGVGGLIGAAKSLNFGINEVSSVLSAGDSVILPLAQAGAVLFVANHGGNDMKVFGTGFDTINGTAGATGVTQHSAVNTIYFCAKPGDWHSTAL